MELGHLLTESAFGEQNCENIVIGDGRFSVGKYYDVESYNILTLRRLACPAVERMKCGRFYENRTGASSYLVNLWMNFGLSDADICYAHSPEGLPMRCLLLAAPDSVGLFIIANGKTSLEM
jgi:hypothetical protein